MDNERGTSTPVRWFRLLPPWTTSTSRSLRSRREGEGEAWRPLAARTARVARELPGCAVAEPAADCRLGRLVGGGVKPRLRALLRARHVLRRPFGMGLGGGGERRELGTPFTRGCCSRLRRRRGRRRALRLGISRPARGRGGPASADTSSARSVRAKAWPTGRIRVVLGQRGIGDA